MDSNTICCSNCEFCGEFGNPTTCGLYCEIYGEYVDNDDAEYCEKFLTKLD